MRYSIRLIFSPVMAGEGFGVVAKYGVDTVRPSKWVVLGFPSRFSGILHAGMVQASWLSKLNGDRDDARRSMSLRDMTHDDVLRKKLFGLKGDVFPPPRGVGDP